MKVELLIDNREQEIKKYFKNHENEYRDYVIFSNLDIGDIIFKVDNEIVLIIERKTIQDLSKSICDGRYKEQKLRLLGSGIVRDRIIYLIEGNLNEYTTIKGGTDTLLSSLVNMMLRDGLRIHKTSSIQETINFLKKILDKLEKNFEELWKYDTHNTHDTHDDDSHDNLDRSFLESKYTSVIKIKKKNNITPETWFHSQLCLIPGISTKVADAITLKYPTLNIFLTQLKGDFKKLKGLEYSICNDKKRKLGDKTIEKLNIYFS